MGCTQHVSTIMSPLYSKPVGQRSTIMVGHSSNLSRRQFHQHNMHKIWFKYIWLYFLSDQPDHNKKSSHTKTVQLSWYVQNVDVIKSVFYKVWWWQFFKIRYWLKFHQWDEYQGWLWDNWNSICPRCTFAFVCHQDHCMSSCMEVTGNQMNSWAPGRCNDFKCVLYEHMLWFKFMNPSNKRALS